jgi:arabinan endo-1,5-alpha-L-arabinosidase
MYPIEKTVLTSPENAPIFFEIAIIENTETIFKISSKDLDKEPFITDSYRLKESSHSAYLDLFQQIAHKFNLRYPKNREFKEQPAKQSEVNYSVVLTKNLDDGMYYGYGDPAILSTEIEDETWYYLVSTSNDALNAFPLIKSQDLRHWTFCNYLFPEYKKPAWAAEGEFVSDYWAPEMHRVGNEFRTYFVARDKLDGELCIGLVRSDTPEGDYIAEEKPVISGNVIDPHVFVQNEKTFLFWKEDNNDIWPQKLTELLAREPDLIDKLFTQENDKRTAAFTITIWTWARNLPAMERFFVLQLLIEAVTEQYSSFEERLTLLAKEKIELADPIFEILRYMKTPMYVQQLSDDGTRLIGERSKILENDMPWEAHLVEGMWLTFHENKYYLFYAGNDFSTDQYGIGYAVSDKLTGPYVKNSEPLLKSTNEWRAPGHPSVVRTKKGEYLMFFHAYFPGQAGYKKFRALLQIPLYFKEGKVSLLKH